MGIPWDPSLPHSLCTPLVQTRWGSLCAPPDPLVAMGGGLLLRGEREGEEAYLNGTEGKGG